MIKNSIKTGLMASAIVFGVSGLSCQAAMEYDIERTKCFVCGNKFNDVPKLNYHVQNVCRTTPERNANLGQMLANNYEAGRGPRKAMIEGIAGAIGGVAGGGGHVGAAVGFGVGVGHALVQDLNDYSHPPLRQRPVAAPQQQRPTLAQQERDMKAIRDHQSRNLAGLRR